MFVGRLSSLETMENNEMLNEKELTMEELMKMPAMVPTVDNNGLVITNPTINPKLPPNSVPITNSAKLPSYSDSTLPVGMIPREFLLQQAAHSGNNSHVLIIPAAKSTVQIAIHSGPAEIKSPMADLLSLSRGSTYRTKTGKIRGRRKKLSSTYSPPMDLLKDLVF